MVKDKSNVVLVTGATGGIGKSIVNKYSRQGLTLAIADKDEEQANKLVHEINHGNGKAMAFPGDLLDQNYCDSLANEVQKKLGSIDILINNAGLMRRGDITQTSDEDYDLSMKINVEAPFRLIRAAIPLMAEAGGGSIVNVSSCWGINPGPNHLIYCTTKAALAAMTKCLGRDHAHQNIRINAVCPNEVNTPMLRTGFEIRGLNPDDAIEELNQSVPIGHIAEPEEIANVVSFLSSDEARYICGSLVEINGGKAVY
ncbi:short-chain dehydrogenase [Candidatus Pseudothioglobus singularis]|jgi:NAD(P)-dependent dehydrogenase (short-subunit alcohol dehydrogenase family)|uniref:SDR family NAD(P)-dependent oxidoreductase n=1 Tax=Candidatus Pseudothioglobus singularis TaxID=1427364 RepID=UPI0008064482|nr:SDR family oxidoreductase [Candidatus Pseudothioglobus singularis]ANQ65872.1 short-chain dehydrogenase [Candidatus Pseudothioglobus singularis]